MKAYKVIDNKTGDIIYIGRTKLDSNDLPDKDICRTLRRKDPSVSIETHHIEWFSNSLTMWETRQLKHDLRDNGHSLRLHTYKNPKVKKDKLKYVREWRKENPDKMRKYSRKAYVKRSKDPEKRKKKNKKQRELYKDNKEYHREYLSKNRDKINEYQKKYYRKKRREEWSNKITKRIMNEDKHLNDDIPKILNRQISGTGAEDFDYENIVEEISNEKMRKQIINFLYYSDNVIKEYSSMSSEDRLQITTFLSHMRSWIRNQHMDKPNDLKKFDSM